MKELLSRIWNDASFVERLARAGIATGTKVLAIAMQMGLVPGLTGGKSWFAALAVAVGGEAAAFMIPAGQKNGEPPAP